MSVTSGGGKNEDGTQESIPKVQIRKASDWMRTRLTFAYDNVHAMLFGRPVVEEDDKASAASMGSKPLSGRSISHARSMELLTAEENESIGGETNFSNDDIDKSRNLVVDSYTMFRKGPVPIECLSHSEQVRLSKLGCLKEWDDSKASTSDNFVELKDFEENPNSKTLLTYFARLGSGEDDQPSVNLSFVRSLLESGASFNYPDVHGQSIFFAIVRDWHIDVAQFAIEEGGALVNHADKYGRTPLHLAVSINYAEMVELLIEFGADLEAVTKGERQNALHYAARYGSVDCLKILIENGSRIDSLDFMERTPMQVAAEIGNEASVKYFIKQEAPVGVYDINGCSAMMMIIEKMPHLAYEGLNQFLEEYHAMRRMHYYLNTLEFGSKPGAKSFGRNVLQTIVQYKKPDLVIHPAIVKLLDVKWKLFGRRHAIVNNFLNIWYTILATVITFAIPFHPYDQQFTPLNKRWWKIVLAALFILNTLYFWVKQIIFARRLAQRDSEYKEFRLEALRKQLPYCHPAWYAEREYYDLEVARIKSYSSAFWDDWWNAYEWVSLFFVLLQVALLVANDLAPDDRMLFPAAKLISAFSLLLIWLRLYKSLRVFTIFSELAVLLGFIMIETAKFAVMFIDIFIPYTFFFFMIFGGDLGLTKKTDNKKNHMYTITDIAFKVWKLTNKAKYSDLGSVDSRVGMLMIGVFFALVAFLLQSIYIGRMSEIFCREHQRAISAATLLQATVLIHAEDSLNTEQKREVRRYMREHCGPMIVTLKGSMKLGDDTSVKLRIQLLMKEIEELTTYLGKVSFLKEEACLVNLDRFKQVESEVKRVVECHALIEEEMKLVKTKVKGLQKINLDMIRDVIDERAERAGISLKKNM